MNNYGRFWRSQSKQNGYKLELLKVCNMTSLKIYVSGYGEARNIKFGHQINLIQRVQLGPLPQEVVTSLPDNNVTLTNLFISSYRRVTVIKLG